MRRGTTRRREAGRRGGPPTALLTAQLPRCRSSVVEARRREESGQSSRAQKLERGIGVSKRASRSVSKIASKNAIKSANQSASRRGVSVAQPASRAQASRGLQSPPAATTTSAMADDATVATQCPSGQCISTGASHASQPTSRIVFVATIMTRSSSLASSAVVIKARRRRRTRVSTGDQGSAMFACE